MGSASEKHTEDGSGRSELGSSRGGQFEEGVEDLEVLLGAEADDDGKKVSGVNVEGSEEVKARTGGGREAGRNNSDKSPETEEASVGCKRREDGGIFTPRRGQRERGVTARGVDGKGKDFRDGEKMAVGGIVVGNEVAPGQSSGTGK